MYINRAFALNIVLTRNELCVTLSEERNTGMGRTGERILTNGAVADRISVSRVIESATSATFVRTVDVLAVATFTNENSATATQSRRALALFTQSIFFSAFSSFLMTGNSQLKLSVS